MSHPSQEQLSALLDEALPPAERAGVEAHLAGCDTCRAEFEALRAADALVGETFSHDPGDAYFESFAARVSDRITADEARGGASSAGMAKPLADTLPPARPVREAPPWYDIGSWFGSPARLAWVGGVAALVVTAGVALMIGRESGVPELRQPTPFERGLQTDAPRDAGSSEAASPEAAPGSPAAVGQLKEKVVRESEQDADALEERVADSRLAAPARVREMKQMPGGEDLPVGRNDVPEFARTPAAAAPPAPPGEVTRVTRQRRAEPLRANESAPAPATKDEAEAPAVKTAREGQKTDALDSAKRAASSLGAAGVRGGASDDLSNRPQLEKNAGVCGFVVDAKGRPVAKAQVVLGNRGVTATSGEDGRFCFEVAAGAYDLTVLAVGFTPLRQQVTLGDATPAQLTVQTVEVLPAPLAQAPSTPGLASTLGDDAKSSADAAHAVPDSVIPGWREAERIGALALRERSAARFDAVGAAWNDVIRKLARGEAQVDARGRHAEALFSAWEIEPTGARASAAASALRAFIEAVPPGPRRDRARQMLARLQP